VLGTDERTGGGGGNVVTHSNLWKNFKAAEKAAAALGNEKPVWPLGGPIPEGVDLRVPIRRPLRVKGPPEGLEDHGVEPDRFHPMTSDDVLHGNRDLLDEAADLLKIDLQEKRKGRRYSLKEAKRRGGQNAPIVVETSGIDRLAWFVDGEQRGSQRVKADRDMVAIVFQPGDLTKPLCLEGYHEGREGAVAKRKIRLMPV
jgi:hypothetical protein